MLYNYCDNIGAFLVIDVVFGIINVKQKKNKKKAHLN